MELILDEWIVREVIDTLYMARTTLLGITGLDSPQDVAKKSANETAITRRISKAIDIIQQPEQQSLPQELEEAAEKYRRESYGKSILPNIDGPMPEYVGSVKDAFIAGAEWQKEQDEKELSEKIASAYQLGLADKEKQMMDEWLKDRDGCFWDGVEEGKKAMREQMMKEAVEGEVMTTGFSTCDPVFIINRSELSPETSFKDGDKVRIIIVKEG